MCSVSRHDNRRMDMARGQRRSIDMQLEILDSQIEKAQRKLDDLLEQREALENQKREEEVGKLYDMLMASEKSFEEVEQFLLGTEEASSIA